MRGMTGRACGIFLLETRSSGSLIRDSPRLFHDPMERQRCLPKAKKYTIDKEYFLVGLPSPCWCP